MIEDVSEDTNQLCCSQETNGKLNGIFHKLSSTSNFFITKFSGTELGQKALRILNVQIMMRIFQTN